MSKEAVRTARESILTLLEPLFERAEREGLWFYCSYQSLWFSPAQLRAAHKDGRFIWGPMNWQLRVPRERVEEAERRAEAAMREAHRVKAEVEAATA